MRKDEEERASRVIDRVKILIEKCIIRYMTKEETMQDLLEQEQISPEITQIVWEDLEKDNKEFFQHYYARLCLTDQIKAFNCLLEKQAQLMAAGAPSGVAPIPPPEVKIGGHRSLGHQIINSSNDASALHGSMDSSTSSCASANPTAGAQGLNSRGNSDFASFQDCNPARSQTMQTIGNALAANQNAFFQHDNPLITQAQQSMGNALGTSFSPFTMSEQQYLQKCIASVQTQQTIGDAPGASFTPFTMTGQQYVQETSHTGTSSHAVSNQNVGNFDASKRRSSELNEPNAKRFQKQFTRTWKDVPRQSSFSAWPNSHIPSIQNPDNSLADCTPSTHENTPSEVESSKTGTPEVDGVASSPDLENASNTTSASSTNIRVTTNSDHLRELGFNISDLGSPGFLADLSGHSFSETFPDDDLSSSVLHQALRDGNLFCDSVTEDSADYSLHG